MQMIRSVLTLLAIAVMSLTVSGCVNSVNELEQNQNWADYRCNLMPGRECRW